MNVLEIDRLTKHYPIHAGFLRKEVARDRQRRFRLIGVGASELAEPGAEPVRQNDLFGKEPVSGPDDPRSAKVEKAIDAVRDKFGLSAIRKGRGLGRGRLPPRRG